MMNKKTIFIGEVEESFQDTPIDIFKWAIRLSREDKFIVRTNNPQLVEALEVLCGEANVDVYLKLDFKTVKVSFITAYNYLGDIYDTIDAIRIKKGVGEDVTDEWINKEIQEYKNKYKYTGDAE